MSRQSCLLVARSGQQPGYSRIAPVGVPAYWQTGPTIVTPGSPLTTPTPATTGTLGYFFPSYSQALPELLDDAIEPDDADPDADPATTNPAPTTTDPTTAADPTDEEDEIDLEYWFPSYTEALRELMAEVFEEE